MVRQIRKRKEPFAPISQRQLRESKEEEEEEVSRVENACCSTSNNSDMSARKRRREEVSDSTREGENSVEENGATPRKQRKYDSAAEAGHSAAQQRGEKRKYTEEPVCESPVVKKRTVQSSSEEDPETTLQQRKYDSAAETGHSAAQQRGKKRKYTEEPECESPVSKKARTDKAGVRGTILIYSTESKKRETASLGPENFIFHKIIEEGDYGKIVLATHRDSGILVTIKIVHKRYPLNYNPGRVLNERIAMEMAKGSLFCAHAYATFQTETYICFVMDYMRSGDLGDVLRDIVNTNDTVDLPTLRLLAAELVCGLQHLHSRGIVHRDIKYNNILVDSTGHVKIADYGFAATNVYGGNMLTEYLGYMFNAAPEMLFEVPYDGAVDYFALGTLLFMLAFDQYPFEGQECYHTLSPQPIMYAELRKIPGADPDVEDFLEKLLCKDPTMRNKYIANIRDHRFFNGINWKEVEAGEARPPFFGHRKGFRNLTRDTIKPEDLMNNINNWGKPIKNISDEEQKLFNGFSFVSDEWKAMQKLK